MAPMCPAEVDVFTIPHTRMKELVEQYLHMLTSTNFADAVHLTNLLENLCKTFREFIAHEQIENRYIMKKLKNKLHSLSIENNAVCNCHKDNQLTDMLDLLRDGYKCTKKSDTDRNNYGIKLSQALERFTQTFIPHMEEEEEVFQPLLMQHFSVEELKQIKAKVIEQHFKIEVDESPEKFVHDNKSSKLGKKTDQSQSVGPSKFDLLPDEVVLKVLSNLNPRDLCRASQVSTRWHQLAVDGSLWTELFPVSWAKGNWDAHEGVYEEDEEESVKKKLECKIQDEDADVDESEGCDDWDTEAVEIQRQSKMLTSMCRHLLPQVGQSVRNCDLAYSKGLTNGALYKILSLCPNLEFLDLTQTRISDLGFKGLQKPGRGQKLRHVDLTGCLYITDKTLERLAEATRQNTAETGRTKPGSHVTESSNQSQSHGPDNEKLSPVTEQNSLQEEDEKKAKNKTTGEQVCGRDDPGGEDCNVGIDGALNEVCDTECDERCETSNEGVEQASSGLEDALSRLRCCHSSRGCCRCDTDIETSQTAWKCCRKAGKVYCERCPWRTGQNGERSRTNMNDPPPAHTKFVQCQGHTEKEGERSRTNYNDHSPHNYGRSLLSENEGERSRTFNNDQPPSDNGKPPTNGNEGPGSGIVCDKQPESSDETVSGETKAESTPGQIHETTVEVVPDPNDVVNEEFQPENWEIPGQTFIPELYILPGDRGSGMISDLDPDVNDTKTLPELKNAMNKVAGSDQVTCGRSLQFLSLSGCYQITDLGLQYLTDSGGLPNLRHLDLSGCLNLSGEAVSQLVSTAVSLEPANLFYCDNIVDGPYTDTASGCQNLQCMSRVCCRVGE